MPANQIIQDTDGRIFEIVPLALEAEHAAGGHDGIYVKGCTTCPVFNSPFPEFKLPLDGCTCGEVGSTGAHFRGCQWAVR